MLEVQKYLHDGGSLDMLTEEFGINIIEHPSEPLIIANYDQVDSKKHKFSQIVRECRALCLEKNTWKCIGKSFDRFYNFGEAEEHASFDWTNFRVYEKLDGSLISLLNYNGTWRAHTRGSFGQHEMYPNGPTWHNLFFPLVKNLHLISENLTLVCEGCSMHNKVIIDHPEPKLVLLSVFDRTTCQELPDEEISIIAKIVGLRRPLTYEIFEQESILRFVKSHAGNIHEGVILKDSKMRMKCKNPEYVALSHLKNNGNIFLPKYLVPIVLKGDYEKLVVGIPELKDHIERAKAKLDAAYIEAKAAFDACSHLTNQGEKARMVCRMTKLTAPCFTSWKTKRPFDEIWMQSEKLLVKYLFE